MTDPDIDAAIDEEKQADFDRVFPVGCILPEGGSTNMEEIQSAFTGVGIKCEWALHEDPRVQTNKCRLLRRIA